MGSKKRATFATLVNTDLRENDKFAHIIERLAGEVAREMHRSGQLDYPEATKQVIYAISFVGRPQMDGGVDLVSVDYYKADLLPPKKKAKKRASPRKRTTKKKRRVGAKP